MQNFERLEGEPAYGRDYKSAKAVKADWEAGKDFQDSQSGSYISNTSGFKGTLEIRYAHLTRVVVINIK